jgi:cytochrome b subunit of formate dehydrogenase
MDALRRSLLFTVVLLATAPLLAAPAAAQTETEMCLMCHDDPGLESEDGRSMTVTASHHEESVHGFLDCIDCHTQDADYEDIPHYDRYQAVDCSMCHDEAVASFRENFHFRALQAGNHRAPDCAGCHGTDGDPHRMHGLDATVAEESCRSCHSDVTDRYDGGVHAASPGAASGRPGCVTCHQSHGPGLPPAAGAVNNMCESCHEGAMDDVERGGHALVPAGEDGLSCASCHDVHGTHRPHMSERVARSCYECHEQDRAAFANSVHADLFEAEMMTCLSCHGTHMDEEEVEQFDAGCGSCHEDVEETYRGSVHRFGRLAGNEGAATCADCHAGHDVRAAEDPESRVHPANIAEMCGDCHGDSSMVASNYVRLPMALPRYQGSVHGGLDSEGIPAATCTDCHGVHDLQHAQNPDSEINQFNLARTCGECHGDAQYAYEESIHGNALQLGIVDAPTCNDCHDEHATRSSADPESATSPQRVARELCGDCHTDPDMAAKYGVTAGVVESYLDSYHSWAIDHGDPLVATCTDCHMTHEIRSPLDPASTIHPDNVTETCGQCHEHSNPTFAQSYTHASALEARGPHGWAKLIYLVLIGTVLGGMGAHNLIVARWELMKHRERRRQEESVVRWQRVERMQHLVLLITFFGLAITGFALRAPDAWWVHLIGLGGNEALRANLHRALAVILTVASVYHLFWLAFTRRGRMNLVEIAPRGSDFVHFPQNMAFHLGLRRERPNFRRFDYTQKAEYWAVIWGTVVMALTGLILWFPDLVTGWLPAWVVRVAAVVHYYEAILAVAAIFIWHFFYVIFLPSEYPVSTIWLDGRMPAHEWKEMHPAEAEQVGERAVEPPREDPGDGDRQH